MEELLASLTSSLERFKEILAQEQTIANRDASIQRFEFSVELAWKCVQKFLKSQSIVCRSPKECLKEAFKFGLVKDDPVWIEMLEDRNLTSHTYQESTAEVVYHRLPNYLVKLQMLERALHQELSKE